MLRHKKHASAFIAFLMAFALIFTSSGIGSLTFTKADDTQTIYYNGESVTLSEHALYVNQNLASSSGYSYKTLQEAVANAIPGTKDNPTIIYLEPDVYWTDDYTKTEDRDKNDLIGLIIPQAYITLVGMTGNRDDVVIASDRGQNAGANGNFNTIGVGDGFHAKDLTIGNYCNVDLVYERDTTKNHTKRQEAVTQAQAVTKVPGITDMDEWFFENCNIISRLNLFSRDDRPKRSLIKDCHLECTDDSLGTGYITIFENCTFSLFSNTPCGGASFYMQAFLGCEFTTQLSDNKTITLCKNTKPFAFIDCDFKGDMTGMEWKQSNFSDDIRQIVSNNTLNGQPLTISPDYPDLSVTPDEEQMKAFKYNGEYNIYNLLNGAGYDEWDPLNQKDYMPTGTWNIQFDYPGIAKDVVPVLQGNVSDSLQVTPVVLGGNDKTVTWSTEDDTLVIEPQDDGTVIVKGDNSTLDNKKGCLVATATNGMKKVLHFTVTPKIFEAPVLSEKPVLSAPENGMINVTYAFTDNSEAADESIINWYRATDKEGTDKVLVAQTTYVDSDAKPYSSYVLRLDDVNHYIICEVIPKRSNSVEGSSVFTAASELIKSAYVADEQKQSYNVDLEHLAYIEAENDTEENNYEWKNTLEAGNWYGGFYLPAEYREGGEWSDKAYKPVSGELPYTYAHGASGASGTTGLQTTTQGARLVYVDDTARKDMSMTLTLSPHKTGAQGFGSAKQFIDIYFKYDAKTMTGYGLRIARVPSISDPALSSFAAKSCTFTLMEYKNGVAIPLEDSVISTAFLPGCTIKLDVTGNTFTADVTTTSSQDSASSIMPHEVHLSHVFENEVNSYSGIGFQHTGTSGAGKSGNRVTIHSVSVDYKGVTGEVIDVPDNDINNGNDDINKDTDDREDVPDSSVDVVPTGDSSDMRILIMLMAVSGLAIGMTVAKSKNSLKAFK